MKFQVPQFIEIEDKIVGPLTIKQFIYVAGGAGLGFIFFKFLPIYISFILIIPSLGLGLALAFYKPNSQPFILQMESAFRYVIGSKLYIWEKRTEKEKKNSEGDEKSEDPILGMQIPKLSDSKLSELGWSLDIKDKLVDDMNNN